VKRYQGACFAFAPSALTLVGAQEPLPIGLLFSMDLPGTALLMRSELLVLAAGACESAIKASAVLLHAAAMQHSSTRLLVRR
jgi:hypothetical protein